MAIHAHSTTMPAPQRGLLRAFAGLARLGSNSREIPGSCTAVEPLAAGESTARQPCRSKGLRSEEALASTAPDALLPLPAPLPSLSAALSRRRAIFGAVEIDEPDTAAQARTLHMRRELHQALDHGLALMDALDLSPRGLDLMDRAIAQLDALEAPEEDLEDDGLAEDDDPAEETSLETFGRGLVRCGADDAEEDDGCERGEEYGSEDAEDIGHHASRFVPRPLTHAERAEVAVLAERAATMPRASCLT